MNRVITGLKSFKSDHFLLFLGVSLSTAASTYFYLKNYMIAYGDAESHLNIAKRVIHGLTPGLAQLGGIWLPLPHLLMSPLVFFDPLWRTGLAGAIISGIAYITAILYLYKITDLVINNKILSFLSALIFSLNPNILYLQSTAMTEVLLIAFFLLSTYYFLKYLIFSQKLSYLIITAFFGFCATLTRYDGWLLVLTQAAILALFHFKNVWVERKKTSWRETYIKFEGKIILFSTLAFMGIVFWLLWDLLILDDPFYFSNSPFSAKSQQKGWFEQGMLPAYKNPWLAFAYYSITAYRNIGLFITLTSLIGLVLFIFSKRSFIKLTVILLLFVPFIFYVITLYQGQSIIFIPDLTPESFQWRLFNVRYGVMMIPAAAFFTGYFFSRIWDSYRSSKIFVRLVSLLFILVISIQTISFIRKHENIISLDDGLVGLSAHSKTDAQYWLADNYDGGLVLLDDYARTISVIRSDVPLQKIIYIGSKPYWEESLEKPEKYVDWIVMQKGDAVWKALYENEDKLDKVYVHFEKAYTSPEILIFRKNV